MLRQYRVHDDEHALADNAECDGGLVSTTVAVRYMPSIYLVLAMSCMSISYPLLAGESSSYIKIHHGEQRLATRRSLHQY